VTKNCWFIVSNLEAVGCSAADRQQNAFPGKNPPGEKNPDVLPAFFQQVH
jgi:hypothetical protein